jgi:hypothetical protein
VRPLEVKPAEGSEGIVAILQAEHADDSEGEK